MPTLPCPHSAVWQSFRLGLVAESEAEALSAHLEGCPVCLEEITHLPVDDPLLEVIRSQGNATPMPATSQVVAVLMERLKRLPAEHNGASPEPAPVQPNGRDTEEPLAAETINQAEAAARGTTTMPPALGRYRLLEPLGAGGMGTVYKAHDPELNRLVAIKVPRFNGAQEAQDRARQRFLREARAAATIRHPHVCPIYDVGADGGIPYVVMAFIEGQSLAAKLEREERLNDCREAVHLVLHVARALEVVHAHGIIHRDLKPHNILLDKAGQAVLTDFGLARPEDDREQLTAEGAVVGTPAYMAPEQIAPRFGTVSYRTDIYSLGVVLYQLVTGRTPFTGSKLGLIFQVAEDDPPWPCELRPDLDPSLEAIIRQAMARRPEERYGSAREVAEALETWLSSSASVQNNEQPQGSHQPGAGPAGGTRPARAVSAADAPTRLAPCPPARTPGRRRLRFLVGGLSVLAASWIGYTLVHRKPHRDNGGANAPPILGTSQASTQANGGANAAAPIKGWIDVRVWEPANERRHGLRLNQRGALPLKPKDLIRIEAELNRPAYLYVFWIDSEGKAQPVYPWRPGRWDERPAREQPRARLSLPEGADAAWPMQAGPAGMETLVLLARNTPLPRDVDLRAHFDGLAQPRWQHPQAAVWFENGEVVQNETERGPNFFEVMRVNDPVMRTQLLLRERLCPLGEYLRAVSFTNEGG
ncbi:hypothetical protein AYO44_11470 [Planctomycetaceae bacterium SCGC AG-212-F19]|nr:hypothetical protein AYO44_11470 [Planctomycetaceae bacterium SCGC AG-212-F19]